MWKTYFLPNVSKRTAQEGGVRVIYQLINNGELIIN
jgi:hypothetical protein